MTHRRLWGLLLITALAGLLAACSPRDDVWQRVQDTGMLRVGMDASYPPFEDLDENGQPVGFDVDFARAIGEEMGVEVAFTNIAYDGLYDALVAGQVDVLISALVPAYAVESKTNFSDPYFNVGEMLVVPVGSEIEEMGDLSGYTLAVEYGSGGDVEARLWERRLADLTILRRDDPTAALGAVLSGEADAALVDGISARLGVGGNPDELALRETLNDTLYAVAVREDSAVLLDEVNEAVEALFDDDTIAALTEKWFGTDH